MRECHKSWGCTSARCARESWAEAADAWARTGKRRWGVVLLCEHVCPVTRSTHLAGERSAGMKHFGGATTAVNLALDKYQKIACGIP